MSERLTADLVLAAVPVVGAIGGLALRRQPDLLKVWLLLATMTSLGAIGWLSGRLPAQAAALPLLALPPIMAFLSLLGQPLHRANGAAWILTLLLLGSALGVLDSAPSQSMMFLLFLLALVGAMLWWYQRPTKLEAWSAVGTVALGMLMVTVALLAPPLSAAALALACAVVLPLPPFHKAYLAALTSLPGNLPAFLALLLPIIGFHVLLTTLPLLSDAVLQTAWMLALGGSLYASLRALTQSRAAAVIAYGAVAFLSIFWWYLAETRAAAPHAVVYLSAVGLATGGLLLAAYVLRTRFGEISFRGLSGLAQPMPRLAVVLSLLALAALGLPPFGVFAGFLGMLLAPSFTWSAGLLIILLAWLAASWYLFELVQGLLFGRPQAQRRHEDLADPEFAALALILVLLVTLGVLPSRLFEVGTATQRTVVMEPRAWNR